MSNVILDRRPWSDPLGVLRRWGQKVKIIFFFSEYGHVAHQLRTQQQHGSKYFYPQTPTPDPGSGAEWSKFNVFRIWSCCISN